ncbi:hypothetical protein G5714_016064 [Onychostoma macrolepis]|uniref:Uncharacterized protein n=1 Tax=Onychostoma macrolepis TaxID=369639 RepID=A0A7J6C814_9TELE|nr:hypothetical protein G5714_016064 [Onychostoma macrolepis]
MGLKIPDTTIKPFQDIYCYWPPNNVQSLLKKRTLPDKIKWNRLQVHRVFKSSVDYMTAHKLMRKAQITSCPELSDSSITEKRLTRLKRPPLRLLESDSDITDIEDSNINTRPPAKIPTLPSPPRTMEPRRNSSETPEPSQTCGGLDSLPRAGFCEMPGGYRSAVHMDSTQSMMTQHLAPRMQEWSHEHNSNVDQHQHKSAWTASGNGSWTDTQRQNYDFNSNGQNCTSNNRAIMKSQPGSTSMDAESQIAETLKHAPGLVRRKANSRVGLISW